MKVRERAAYSTTRPYTSGGARGTRACAPVDRCSGGANSGGSNIGENERNKDGDKPHVDEGLIWRKLCRSCLRWTGKHALLATFIPFPSSVSVFASIPSRPSLEPVEVQSRCLSNVTLGPVGQSLEDRVPRALNIMNTDCPIA